MAESNRLQSNLLPHQLTTSWPQLLRRLSRLELSAMVALSALAGQLFASRHWSLTSSLLTLAVLLLAGGCSALNQWQEQDLDARMERTCNRPLPAGQLTPATVLLLAITTLGFGLLLLQLLPDLRPLLLGLLAVIWYNGIYTPLKRRTPFAALPGAICGALPPLIGWSASGAPLLEAPILLLFGTLCIWQIPHSWLLLCHYRQDLTRSGLPNLFERISTDRLLQINHCWLAALLLAYLQFPLFGYLHSPPLTALLLVGMGGIGIGYLQRVRRQAPPLQLFHLTNLSMALLLTVILLDCSLP